MSIEIKEYNGFTADIQPKPATTAIKPKKAVIKDGQKKN